MASKKELHTEVMGLCEQYKAPKELVSALDELLKPGKGGASVNVDDVFVAQASDGKSYLLCSVSGLWMEATADNFYEDTAENAKFGGLKRLSRAAEAARKKAIGLKRATEKAVMQDLLDGVITADEAKSTIEAVAGPDFSGIEGLTTRPN